MEGWEEGEVVVVVWVWGGALGEEGGMLLTPAMGQDTGREVEEVVAMAGLKKILTRGAALVVATVEVEGMGVGAP